LPPVDSVVEILYNHDKIIHDDYQLQGIQDRLTIRIYPN